MNTIIKDDRTEEQKATHFWAVVAKDTFMSRWGLAKGGVSRCAWACQGYDAAAKAYDWVKSRKEMQRVSIVDLRKYSPPKTDAHFHVYVCGPSHRAFDEN